jgi:hypothetical protein
MLNVVTRNNEKQSRGGEGNGKVFAFGKNNKKLKEAMRGN